MTKPKLIICVGLQRSGNHAILGWVESLIAGATFWNDARHDVFADETALRVRLAAAAAPCVIVSFEDSANRTATPDVSLLESVAPLPAAIEAEYDVRRLAILRDPYNTWASRVAANARAVEFGGPLTSDPSWELFRANWLALAALERDPAWRLVLFNRWKGDDGYRRALCAEIGGIYSDAALDAVSRRGGGSSFDGTPRPSYREMLRRLPSYLSSDGFLRRLRARPGHYVKRFLAPPKKGRELEVEARWKTLLGRPEAAGLFADPDLRVVTAGLFGADAVPPAAAEPRGADRPVAERSPT